MFSVWINSLFALDQEQILSEGATLNEPERIGPGKEEGVLIAVRSTEAGNVIEVVYVKDPLEHPGYDAFIITLVRR